MLSSGAIICGPLPVRYFFYFVLVGSVRFVSYLGAPLFGFLLWGLGCFLAGGGGICGCFLLRFATNSIAARVVGHVRRDMWESLCFVSLWSATTYMYGFQC